MQIAIFSYDIAENVKMYCDAHVRKLGIEATQLLANSFFPKDLLSAPLTQTGGHRKQHQVNLPLSQWVRKNTVNFVYTYRLGKAIFAEYTYRYGKRHFTEDFLDWIWDNRYKVFMLMHPVGLPSSFIQAIPDKYKRVDTVEAYRAYFNGDKRHLFRWKNRPIPWWVKQEV